MYHSTTPALAFTRQPSEAVQDFAQQLRIHAEVLEAVRGRLGGAEAVGWESPAGRNVISFLREQSWAVAAGASLLREAAVSLDAYSTALGERGACTGPEL